MPGLVRVAPVGADGAESTVLEVTMAHASRRNVLGPQMLDELVSALSVAAAQNARAVIIRAEPGVTTWSAGYDISVLPSEGADALAWTSPLDPLVHCVRSAPFPVVAAIEGGVWGGACELAVACDLVVAVRTATFAITPARLGVPYSTAGVARFLAALPTNIAREMFFTADPITAAQAAAFGMVNRLVDDGDRLGEAARGLARRIATRAPLTVRTVKAQIAALTDERSLASEDVARLAELQRNAWSSGDYQEGIRAFTEKRPAEFTGG